jgi:hypothetical protein
MIMAALAICTLLAAHAQDSRNPSFLVGVTNVKNNYAVGKQKATVGSVLGQLTSAVLAGQTTTKLEGYEDEVKAAIVRGITNTYRLDAIDGNLSESEAAKPGSMYVDATIDNISYTQKTTYYESSKRTYTYYMGQISVTLLFKDAKTDKVVISPSFRLSEYDCSWMETAEKAISNALNSLSRNVRSYLDQCYPLRANIVEGAREKKDKQKEVYIDLGNHNGVYEGLHFGVYLEKQVAGKIAERQIGKLKIIEVQGPDISLCKVQSGGRDIKAAIDAGQNIVVKTME